MTSTEINNFVNADLQWNFFVCTIFSPTPQPRFIIYATDYSDIRRKRKVEFSKEQSAIVFIVLNRSE